MTRLRLLALATLAATSAQAVEFTQLQANKSVIAFTYQEMGVKMDGKFKKFVARLNFDPANPAAANVAVDVDLSSIDAGSDEADDEVVKSAWLNAKAFPTAHFVSTGFTATAPNRFDVHGKLTIKGKTQDIVFPATFATQGGMGTFDGAFVIHRADFTIGEGSWAKFDVIANDITVRTHMSATPGK
jgi:polyisoprenoid-binding protein YceI